MSLSFGKQVTINWLCCCVGRKEM